MQGCTNCGADRVVVHSMLACTDTVRRWFCACCGQAICLTCREELGDPSDLKICDGCWCAKFDPEDEAVEGFRLMVEMTVRKD